MHHKFYNQRGIGSGNTSPAVSGPSRPNQILYPPVIRPEVGRPSVPYHTHEIMTTTPVSGNQPIGRPYKPNVVRPDKVPLSEALNYSGRRAGFRNQAGPTIPQSCSQMMAMTTPQDRSVIRLSCMQGNAPSEIQHLCNCFSESVIDIAEINGNVPISEEEITLPVLPPIPLRPPSSTVVASAPNHRHAIRTGGPIAGRGGRPTGNPNVITQDKIVYGSGAPSPININNNFSGKRNMRKTKNTATGRRTAHHNSQKRFRTGFSKFQGTNWQRAGFGGTYWQNQNNNFSGFSGDIDLSGCGLWMCDYAM